MTSLPSSVGSHAPVVAVAGLLAAVDVAGLVAGFRLRRSDHDARSLSHRATYPLRLRGLRSFAPGCRPTGRPSRRRRSSPARTRSLRRRDSSAAIHAYSEPSSSAMRDSLVSVQDSRSDQTMAPCSRNRRSRPSVASTPSRDSRSRAHKLEHRLAIAVHVRGRGGVRVRSRVDHGGPGGRIDHNPEPETVS